MERKSKKELIIEKFIVNQKIIEMYCERLSVDKRKYISILFGELYNNYDLFDELDDLQVRYGLDPSVGFGQIRVSTFHWIESKFSKSILITKSKNKSELVRKILNKKYNIIYSIFYVKIIKEKFKKLFGYYPSVDIMASYYSRGIDYHRNIDNEFYINSIGNTAIEFYESKILIDEFPISFK